jgi:hypothetical protein
LIRTTDIEGETPTEWNLLASEATGGDDDEACDEDETDEDSCNGDREAALELNEKSGETLVMEGLVEKEDRLEYLDDDVNGKIHDMFMEVDSIFGVRKKSDENRVDVEHTGDTPAPAPAPIPASVPAPVPAPIPAPIPTPTVSSTTPTNNPPPRASGRLQGKRIQLSMACRCGDIVADAEKSDPTRVVRCKAAGGCETIWVSTRLIHPIGLT